jgi:uncharacterized membrane protein
MRSMTETYGNNDGDREDEYGIGLYLSALAVGVSSAVVVITRADQLVALETETVVLVVLLAVVLALLLAMIAGYRP